MLFKKIIKLSDYSPKSKIEEDAIDFLKILKEYSQVYFVGGYPRDLLINNTFNKKNIIEDIDIAIKKTKKDFKAFLESRNIDYKILNDNLGVYLAKFKDFSFQIAFLRQEGKSINGRKPEKVKFISSISKDSKRRDFTINAFYLDPFKKIIIDFNNGLKDLKKQKIKFIGPSEKRIKEDYLRILRYIRFKNKYNLITKVKDLELLKKYSSNLDKISKDRIKIELEELFKISNTNNIFYELDKFKILETLFPELKKLQGVIYKVNDNINFDVYSHTINCLKGLSNKILPSILKKKIKLEFDDLTSSRETKEYLLDKYGLTFFWAILFHEIGKISPKILRLEDNTKQILFENHEQMSLSIAMDIMKRYSFSREAKEEIIWLITNHDTNIKNFSNLNPIEQKKFSANKNFIKLILIELLEIIMNYNNEKEVEQNLKELNTVIQVFNDTQEDKRLMKCIINKDSLKEFGIQEGQVLENIIQEAENLYWEGKIKTKNGLQKFIEKKTGKIL